MAVRDTSLGISGHIPSALKMDKECAVEGPVPRLVSLTAIQIGLASVCLLCFLCIICSVFFD
jgi:multisubunit Na+/H+ antiporter MnhC subunit